MSVTTAKVSERLQKPDKPLKKCLNISLPMKYIEELDVIARTLSKQSGKSVRRNMLIEDAIDNFIEEATLFLQEKGIDVDMQDDAAHS